MKIRWKIDYIMYDAYHWGRQLNTACTRTSMLHFRMWICDKTMLSAPPGGNCSMPEIVQNTLYFRASPKKTFQGTIVDLMVLKIDQTLHFWLKCGQSAPVPVKTFWTPSTVGWGILWVATVNHVELSYRLHGVHHSNN
jgi:hypothetical protein